MIMQRAMNLVFGDGTGKNIMIYMDDIFILTEILGHKKRVEQAIEKLRRAKFRINLEKIQYCKNVVKILGMIVDGKERTSIDKQKNLEVTIILKYN